MIPQRLDALAAGLLDQQVVDAAHGLELAADAPLPLAEVEPRRGDRHPRQVVAADQLEGVVAAFFRTGWWPRSPSRGIRQRRRRAAARSGQPAGPAFGPHEAGRRPRAGRRAEQYDERVNDT